MSNLTIFNFESHEIRFVGTADNPWFVAADVCAVLEIKNNRDAITRLDNDEKDDVAITDTIGRRQMMTCVNESGLYAITFTSRKPQAKRFRKWITSEVLPSIRKTGSYSLVEKPMTSAEILLMQAQRLVDQEKKLLAIESVQVEQSDRLNAIEAEQGRYNYPSGQKFTVMGFANLNGINISAKEAADKGRKASLICRSQNIAVERIHDPRFGKVGIYPTDILVEVFKGN